MSCIISDILRKISHNTFGKHEWENSVAWPELYPAAIQPDNLTCEVGGGIC
jgi:hypothetical protein